MSELAALPEGMFSLADLPQRGSVAKLAYGVGWPELDEIFKIYPGQFVVVTGKAGQGKSTFVLNALVKLAYEQGTVSFLYVPENEVNLRDKLRRIWPLDDVSFEFLSRTKFIIQTSARTDKQPYHTMQWILGRAAAVIESHNVEIVFIDPWNELDRAKPKDMLLSDYIGECIMHIKDFCRTLGVTVIICAHPTKAVNENGGRLPQLSDIEGCYSDDTEVLTRRGWLHHGQVTLSDEIACFDPDTSSVVYAQPTNVLRKEFDGEMFCYKGSGYNLMVTPQHRMLVMPDWDKPVGAGGFRGRPVAFPKGKWSFCRAEKLPRSQFVLPLAGAEIGGADPETVHIGGKVYPAEAFWRLAGWFVAEGHCGPTGLTWSQAESALAEQFTATFAEAGIPASVGWQQPYGKGKRVTGRWYIGARYCPNLVAWFKEHCGEGAENKRIPAAVFELSPRLKRVFLRAYIEGDGSSDSAGFIGTTVSRRLRDDLQRLAVELGIPTSFGTRKSSANSQECYWVRFGAEGRRTVSMRAHRNASRQSYKGLVWCLTVPTGAYFVRRNGCVTACGNSMNWYNKCDNGLIVVRDPERNAARVISAKVREIGAGRLGVCYFRVEPETGVFTPEYGGVA